MNAACHEPIYRSGMVYATRPVPHDWRLFSRDRTYDTAIKHQERAAGYGTATLTPDGWDEVWYCTRCRAVDERRAAAGEPAAGSGETETTA